MHGYIKYFDDSGKNMTFVTDNEKVYDKYNEIWEVIRKLVKVKFAANPVRDNKYLITKLKKFNKINTATINDDNNKNNIPKEKSHYICIPAIDIDSVLKIDNKRGYPQDYTGEIIVTMTSLIQPIKIKKGQKITQLIVSNIMYPEIKKVKFLRNTERNNKVFGKMDEINFSKKI